MLSHSLISLNKKAIEKFEEWYERTFLFTRNPLCTSLNFENKREMQKRQIIKYVSKKILENPKKETQQLRKEIAFRPFSDDENRIRLHKLRKTHF